MRKSFIAAIAVAGLLVGAAPASAAEHREYVGGYWSFLYFEQGNAFGSNSSQVPQIWMDRATSSNPTRWDGWIGAAKNSIWTARVPHGDYWWRTCFEGNKGKLHCGSWFHA
ncbi:hypothetical protein SK803_19155 [Lentzea sp. BCCO 10_0856]|uniref:Uncharacterized protein n=1 Tax=Lentzea miocenica TaxID=3095431 RepID=A0ABU4T2F8_9PSEU|nr:hypothetical protein [Lentzea sp. BCCO 10_0856]MDX8032338.1 hypothetical protein [Lentzea sp. BCCO 10_0856]